MINKLTYNRGIVRILAVTLSFLIILPLQLGAISVTTNDSNNQADIESYPTPERIRLIADGGGAPTNTPTPSPPPPTPTSHVLPGASNTPTFTPIPTITPIPVASWASCYQACIQASFTSSTPTYVINCWNSFFAGTTLSSCALAAIAFGPQWPAAATLCVLGQVLICVGAANALDMGTAYGCAWGCA